MKSRSVKYFRRKKEAKQFMIDREFLEKIAKIKEKIAKIKEEHPNIKKLSMIEREGKEKVDKFIKYVTKILNKNGI